MRVGRILVGLLSGTFGWGCGVDGAPGGLPSGELRQAAKTQNDPGALVNVTMASQVGVVLDDLPASLT